MRSRVFELTIQRPPLGKEDLDYDAVTIYRADSLNEHFDYAIYETASNILTALSEGRLSREHMEKQKASNCEYISRSSPELARNLRRDLDVVEMIVTGPQTVAPSSGGRMPASIAEAHPY
jgi:hypothetical protein